MVANLLSSWPDGVVNGYSASREIKGKLGPSPSSQWERCAGFLAGTDEEDVRTSINLISSLLRGDSGLAY